MIDPTRITDYNLSKEGLEEQILFWVMVANKTAKLISPRLENLLVESHEITETKGRKPFVSLSKIGDLAGLIRKHGIGCYTKKARTVRELIDRDFDLKTCSRGDLLSIYNIGPKTANCFILHTRKSERLGCIDTHVLKYLADLGHKVPKSTPPEGPVYKAMEDKFMVQVDKSGLSASELDLLVWNYYSKNISLEEFERKAPNVSPRFGAVMRKNLYFV